MFTTATALVAQAVEQWIADGATGHGVMVNSAAQLGQWTSEIDYRFADGGSALAEAIAMKDAWVAFICNHELTN